MQGGRSTIKYLTKEQTTQFFSVIEDLRDRALFAVIYHYGLRVSEATLLQLEDVDFERERILITRLKNGVGGERPLFSNTRDLLKHLSTEVQRPLSEEERKMLRQLLEDQKKKSPTSL